MGDTDIDTIRLHACVVRWQQGDREAADELLRSVGRRLELIARKMLRRFPNVRGWIDTNDLTQGALMRLLTTLQKLQPTSPRHFFNLAAVHVRRELLDLARRTAGKEFAPLEAVDLDETPTTGPPDDLDLWCRFHEAAENLPTEERELVGLVFYHGWTHAQAAELFGVDVRTIRRWWQSACLRLTDMVGGELPG
jgi:RNA polymerase sigma-70 factor (ECF subfamily)